MESVIAGWLSFSLLSTVLDGILAILCGVGIFLLLLPFLPSNPTTPQCRRYWRIRKSPTEPRGRNRKTKKSEALNVDLRELKRTLNLTSLMQSMDRKCQNKGSLCLLTSEDQPDEECRTVPVGTQCPVEQRVDVDVPAMSPVTPTAPLAEHHLRHISTFPSSPKTESVSSMRDSPQRYSQPPPVLPLVCPSHQLITFPPRPGHLPDSGTYPAPPLATSAPVWLSSTLSPLQCHTCAIPMGTVSQSSSVNTPWPASGARVISGIGHSLCPPSTFPLGQKRAQNMCPSTSTHHASQQGHISCPSPEGLKSLSGERKTRPSPSWNTEGQSKQLCESQQFSDPRDVGDKVYLHYEQLFWGLPSLHCESLVATAWNSNNSSALFAPSIIFNGMVGNFAEQMQPNISPMLNLRKCQFRPIVQIQVQPSLPNIPTSSVPQIAALKCDHLKFESSQPEGCLLPKLEKGWAEISAFNFTPSEDSLVSNILPEDFPVSPELRQLLEKHLQKWITQKQWEPPGRNQGSLELKQQQGVRPCQSNAYPIENLGQGSGSKQSDISQDGMLVTAYEDSDGDSGLSSSESVSDFVKALEQTMRKQKDRKLGKIYEGYIPVRVPRSWLAVSDAGWKPESHLTNKTHPISNECDSCENTSERAEFLDCLRQSLLERHIAKFWTKHRWGLPLKAMKVIKHLKFEKIQPSPNLKFPPQHSATCAPGTHSKVKFLKLQGELPQDHIVEKVTNKEPDSTPERPAQAPSLVSDNVQQVCREILFGDNHGSTGISLSGSTEDRHPTDSFTSSLGARSCQDVSVENDEKGSSELGPSSRSGSGVEIFNWLSQDPCHREKMVEMKLASLRNKGTMGRVEVKESPVPQTWSKATTESTVQTKPHIESMNKRAKEYPGTNPVSQHPDHPLIKTGIRSVLKSVSENQPGDHPNHVLRSSCSLPPFVYRYHIPRYPTGAQDSSNRQGTVTKFNMMERRSRSPRNQKGFEELQTSQVRNGTPLSPIRPTVNIPERKCLQKPVPPENFFKKNIRLLMQCIFSKRKENCQESLKKCKPALDSAKSQGPGKVLMLMDGEVTEAQALMSAVGQILEEKIAHSQRLQSTKLNELKQEHQSSTYGASCPHRARFYPEQGKNTLCSTPGMTKVKNISEQEPFKKVRFENGQMSMKCHQSPIVNRGTVPTVPTVSACKFEPRVPGAQRHYQHCPRHCFLRGGILSGKL